MGSNSPPSISTWMHTSQGGSLLTSTVLNSEDSSLAVMEISIDSFQKWGGMERPFNTFSNTPQLCSICMW